MKMVECSASQCVELLPLEKSKSPVWSYFGFSARDGGFIEKDKKKRQTVYCKLCNHGLSYNGNITNMLVHLQYKHKEEYTAVTSSVQAQRGIHSSHIKSYPRHCSTISISAALDYGRFPAAQSDFAQFLTVEGTERFGMFLYSQRHAHL